jgi:hypothetical protein
MQTSLDVDRIIRYKLGESIQFSTQAIEQAKEETARAIMEYCHIGAIPEGLIFTWANMTVDLMRYQYASAAAQASDATATETATAGDTGAVKSVRIGDLTLTFEAPKSGTEAAASSSGHAPALDDLVMNYHYQLLAHRRFKR